MNFGIAMDDDSSPLMFCNVQHTAQNQNHVIYHRATLWYTRSMFGFALLYFTGSGQFNCSMRYLAKMKGLSLSDTGLKPVNRVFGKKVHSFPSYR